MMTKVLWELTDIRSSPAPYQPSARLSAPTSARIVISATRSVARLGTIPRRTPRILQCTIKLPRSLCYPSTRPAFEIRRR